jgi:hypothetical protein
MTYIRLTSPSHIDGELSFTNAFADLDTIAKLDLLQDWIGLLTETYNGTLKQMRQETGIPV